MSDERQFSFAAGELSPKLWGRTDLAQYLAGARQMRDFIVLPTGPAQTRPGSQHVTQLPGVSRCVSFTYSEDDAVVLVFSDFHLDVWSASTSQPAYAWAKYASISSPFAEASLFRLQFSQLGNIVTITGPDYEPYRLQRYDWQTWKLDTFESTFAQLPFPLQSLDHGGIGYNFPGAQTSFYLDWIDLFGEPHVRDDWIDLYALADEYAAGDTDTQDDIKAYPRREWDWALSFIVRDQYGFLHETLPYKLSKYMTFPGLGEEHSPSIPGEFMSYANMQSRSTGDGIGWANWSQSAASPPDDIAFLADLPGNVPLYVNKPAYLFSPRKGGDLSIDRDTGAPYVPGFTVVANRWYRGRRGVYGFIGETTDKVFQDVGAEPDWANPPLSNYTPFRYANNDVEVLDGNGDRMSARALASTWYQSRSYFGGRLDDTDADAVTAIEAARVQMEDPGLLFASGVEEFDRFEPVPNADDADPLAVSLVSPRSEIVRWMAAAEDGLIVGTSGTEWLITGSGSDVVITPNSSWPRPLSRYGSSAFPQPQEGPDVIFFAKKKASIPLAMARVEGRWRTIDLSTFAEHLFKGYTIVDWAFADDPNSTLWVARSDGALLTLTFLLAQNVIAWTQSNIAGGLVESVCSIPEGTEDAVYMVVNRDGTRYLERLARTWDIGSDIREAVTVDASASYYGKVSSGVTVTDTEAGTGLIGENVTLTFTGSPLFLAGVVIQIDIEGELPLQVVVISGSGPYLCQVLNRDVLQDTDADDVSIWGVEMPHYWVCSTTVGGLSHLEGQSVEVMADGFLSTQVVAAGRVNLPSFNGAIHAGLQFQPDFESLDAVRERGRKKNIPHVHLELERTRGGEVGTDLAKRMVPIPDRTVQHGYLAIPPVRQQVKVKVFDDWDNYGRVALRQNESLPMTLLGITREIVHGGK